MKRENTLRMPALLASICSTVSSLRLSSLPEGSPTMRRAAAHQRDRLAAGLLQPMQHHDLQQRADMQRRRRAVEADIADERAARAPWRRGRRNPSTDGHEAALDQGAQEIGSRAEKRRSTAAPRPELAAEV